MNMTTQATETGEPVRILHLSDFHFSPDTKWDSTQLLKSLTKAVADLVGDGLAPDLVAITGDVARSGKKKEYDQARDWLDKGLLKKALRKGFSRSHILIVPGNHDVNRTAVKVTAQETQAALLKKKSQRQIERILSDTGDP